MLAATFKDSAPLDLLQAIRNVYQGKSFLHPTIASKVLNELNRPVELIPAPDALTDREMEVLTLVAQGYSNLEIADKLLARVP